MPRAQDDPKVSVQTIQIPQEQDITEWKRYNQTKLFKC